MHIRPAVLYVASLLAPLTMSGQQSPNPQPATVQAQAAPCITTPVATPKPQGNTLALKPPTRLQQYLAAQRKAIEGKYGIVLPDTPTLVPLIPKLTGQPCLPQVVQTTPALKLPVDVSLSIHCNPVVAPKGAAPSAFPLFLPDPHAYAEPGSLNQWEADTAVPDINAKTPCYALKVNPKTNKYFLTQ